MSRPVFTLSDDQLRELINNGSVQAQEAAIELRHRFTLRGAQSPSLFEKQEEQTRDEE